MSGTENGDYVPTNNEAREGVMGYTRDPDEAALREEIKADLDRQAETERRLALYTRGAEMIQRERRRQVEAEGWTPEHDAEHSLGELAWAARVYVMEALAQIRGETLLSTQSAVWAGWPWRTDDGVADGFKPSDDPVRNLVKAGALIAAEIDRLTAHNAPEPQP